MNSGSTRTRSSGRAPILRLLPTPPSLVESLRQATDNAGAGSFHLMGEDLARLSGQHLVAAARAYEQQLEARVPPALRDAFGVEQDRFLAAAHGWLTRYNRSVTDRIQGYLALARACRFEYPWPTVAVIGLCGVLHGLDLLYRFGVVAPLAARLGLGRGGRGLECRVDRAVDLLRRTNRGIFADSVPTVLLGLHSDALRRSGRPDLAAALLDGPLPPVLDEDCRAIARGVYDGLQLTGDATRFRYLAALTRRHFAREQAIFTHHMDAAPLSGPRSAGAPSRGRRSRLQSLLRRRPTLPVPRIAAGRLTFVHLTLPSARCLVHHDTRVEVLGRAYVDPVIAGPEAYRVAVDYVWRRFGDGAPPGPQPPGLPEGPGSRGRHSGRIDTSNTRSTSHSTPDSASSADPPLITQSR